MIDPQQGECGSELARRAAKRCDLSKASWRSRARPSGSATVHRVAQMVRARDRCLPVPVNGGGGNRASESFSLPGTSGVLVQPDSTPVLGRH